MNEQEARNIVEVGIMPGETDSIGLARAEGYVEALEKARVLVTAIKHAIKYSAAEFRHVQNRAIKQALAKWEETK